MAANNINIQWYPGHMTKAKREMQSKISLVDMIIELRDARVPNASKNPLIDELIQQKPRLIVLTKIDKAEADETQKWISFLNNETTKVIGLDVLHDNCVKIITDAVLELVKEKRERQIRKGMNPRAVRCMVCGIPNVGKSTLINRIASKKILETGNRPGVTKATRWVKVNKDIELLDTPGVLWPKFDDENIGMMLAITGAIRDQVLPLEEIAYYALKYLKEYYPAELENYYGVELIDNNYKLFQAFGRKKGYLIKGDEVDNKRVIETFMKDIRDNRFGRITWEKCSGM
ncbi:ribosome biogenesis GTPase A [Breznakia sp. PF5-3]|uniref:ribosome biogenesis GTPase YlqF n=1 Tax=unclassified Breznakia TaxID=2623764 RepID=UPI002406C0B6|nr:MULTISPECIES: ribosome biogenesis GTPase YlqF [unclassified Breznakia]MDF9824390.1 ribosome biogenesis GTPase A [Breznakia sp. PM6-1]MDF9835119.1 ribosome biogenesis GTPase A [Breznakia sp. PF5-3]MDF9838232.1 ribosome biogenesis GTPase A [Breznakia sp. PFB2-8]MDF9860247.1 ribosome biogenesis GTPase A [Breznakia sp. PH5-24]